MKLYLIAGEASGDKLGAVLMRGLKALAPGVSFTGIGGPLMQAEGMVSLFPMEELSVMGILEIVPKYRALKRRIAETAANVSIQSPAALITIDSPDFCLRVARLARAANPALRTIHYVAPSVWAWRPGRAAHMAEVINHVLALLPFEPPYMQAAGMSCDFVGHPVVSEPLATPAEAARFKADTPLLLCLPGSRSGEIKRLAAPFGAAIKLLTERHKGLRVALPTLPHLVELVRRLTDDWAVKPLILLDKPDKRAAFAAADVALAASGTVSLELAANATPMVIAYRMNPLTFALTKRLALIDTVTLVNLVSDTRAIPEFLGPACQPGPIATALDALLTNPQARSAQEAAMTLTMQRLGRGGEDPGLRAARSVLSALEPGENRRTIAIE